MILETTTRDVKTVGLMSVHKATIASSHQAFDAFASQIYSDNYKAIVRELVTNGIDSHNETNNPNPVDVYLPDQLDPYFRVKDYGMGMSHEFCTGGFMSFTTTTKGGSNIAVGQKGIGSKSPFSYTDQFTLRSVHEGIASVYSVFKDEDGIPSIGLLEQTETTEHNGVEFSVPVEEDDFDKFRTAAQNGLPYFFDRVRLHGADFDAPHFVQRGVTWAVRPRESRPVPQVVMGGVAYPIASNQLDYDLRYDDRLGPLLEMPIDLFVPIGSCSVTLSRESLLYDDKTKAAISQVLASIIDEITADIPTMFDHLPGKWEAVKGLHEYLGGDQHQARSRLVLKHSLYQGEKLEMYFKPDPYAFEKVWVIGERRANRRNGYSAPDCPNPKWDDTIHSLTPQSYTTIFIDDLPPTSKSATIKRIKTYVDEELSPKDQVMVIRPHDHEDYSDLIAGFGNIPATDYILTSSLPEPERTFRTAAEKLARPVVRMFQLTEQALRDRNGTITPCRWNSPLREISYADQPTEGVLVVMENFELPAEFWQKFKFFDADELLFVNKSDAAKLKDFTAYEAEFQARLKAELAEVPTLAQSNALKTSCLRELIRTMTQSPALFDNIPKTKPLAKLRTLVETYVIADNYKLSPHVNDNPPKGVDPEALYASIKETHWKFMTFHNVYDRHHIAADTPEFKLMKELI